MGFPRGPNAADTLAAYTKASCHQDPLPDEKSSWSAINMTSGTFDSQHIIHPCHSHHRSKGGFRVSPVSPPFLPNFIFPLLSWAKEAAQPVCYIISYLNRKSPGFSPAGTPDSVKDLLCTSSALLGGRQVVAQADEEKVSAPNSPPSQGL